MPSPSAVPSPVRRAASARFAASRFDVAGSTVEAACANETMPTRYPFGRLSRKRRVVRCATARRLGGTSVATIEREVSIASTTVASSRSTETFACGRARPVASAASASSASAGAT